MSDSSSDDDKERLFGKVSDWVPITIEGESFNVPANLEILRCFQYLDFHIAYENFCWNASCENCATMISVNGAPAERQLCCQTLPKAGMDVTKLPAGIQKPKC